MTAPRLFFFATLLLAAPAVLALDPSRQISQYGHTAWTLQDGVLPGAPTAMVQTRDGYLWIGTRGGLVRFDGVRFVPLAPPDGAKLQSTRILALEAGRDGSLWIATRSSLERWHNGQLRLYETPPSQIASIAEDREGRIWFTRMSVRDDKGPLCEIKADTVACHGIADGVPIDIGRQLIVDQDGAFWTISDNTLMRWQAGKARTWLPPGIDPTEAADVIQSVERTRDGSVWVGGTVPGRGLGLMHLVDDKLQPYVTPDFDGRKISVAPVVEDRDGGLWVGTQDSGVYRLYRGRVSHYSSAQGLSGDTIQGVFEDREGTVWVMTTRGIDAFRDVRIASVTSREGLSADLANGVLATRDGAVWINTWHWLDVLRDGKVTSLSAHKGFPGEEVLSMHEDKDGAIWMGIDNKLFVYERGRFEPLTRSDGSPAGFVRGIIQDVAGDIWAMAGRTGARDAKLLRIRDRRIVQEVADIPFQHRIIASDPGGGIWFPLTNGDVARYREGRLETVAFQREPGTGIATGLVTFPDGTLVGSTPLGLIGVRDGKPWTMTETNGLPCLEVHALLSDRRGGLWLYASCGVVFIAPEQVQGWWKDQKAVLQFRVFDALDGAQPARGNFHPNASAAPDGRLWFANASITQVIEPDRLGGNTLAPAVHIEQLVADRNAYPVQPGLRLPPLTRDLQIDYTGLSMVIPRKTQFRYRLTGHDVEWQEAGTRRQAFYTDLPPGDYVFHVTASNNDGVWNEQGSSLAFSVTPTFYQTSWFAIVCAVAAGGLLALVYALRVRQLTKREQARFEERLAERTRLARELHDTLLQTIQGSKLVAEHALEAPADGARLRRAMEQLSAWLGQAVKEGRDALRALRGPGAGLDDLAAALKKAAESTQIDGAMQIRCATIGQARELHPIVADEVYRIGYEAIRNAFMHSGAGALDIEVTYDGNFRLRVSDDGKGIAEEVGLKGKEDHFGLRGMRERAMHIGAELTVHRPPGGKGTRVELVVPERAFSRK